MGSRSPILVRTGRPSGANERPKSSRTMRLEPVPVLHVQRLVEPEHPRRSGLVGLADVRSAHVAGLELDGIAGGQVDHHERDEGDADAGAGWRAAAAAARRRAWAPILRQRVETQPAVYRCSCFGHEPVGEVPLDAGRARAACRRRGRRPPAARRASRGRPAAGPRPAPRGAGGSSCTRSACTQDARPGLQQRVHLRVGVGDVVQVVRARSARSARPRTGRDRCPSPTPARSPRSCAS